MPNPHRRPRLTSILPLLPLLVVATSSACGPADTSAAATSLAPVNEANTEADQVAKTL